MTDFYSAKQVATRIGTDAKTLRKFLRSNSSPYTAVGQGKRYEFPQADLAEIKAAFNKWQVKKPAGNPNPKPSEEAKPTSPVAKHAAAINDKGRCLKCNGLPNDSRHGKIMKSAPRPTPDPDSARRTREAVIDAISPKPPYDDPENGWRGYGDDGDDDTEPTEAELAEVEDLMEDLDDDE